MLTQIFFHYLVNLKAFLRCHLVAPTLKSTVLGNWQWFHLPVIVGNIFNWGNAVVAFSTFLFFLINHLRAMTKSRCFVFLFLPAAHQAATIVAASARNPWVESNLALAAPFGSRSFSGISSTGSVSQQANELGVRHQFRWKTWNNEIVEPSVAGMFCEPLIRLRLIISFNWLD